MAFQVEDYLAYFDFPKPVKRGVNWMSSCPDFDKRHNHGDRRYSWGIHQNSGVSNCFVCGGMSLELLTSKLLTRKTGRFVDLLEAMEWLEERYGIKNPSPSELARIGMTLADFDELRRQKEEVRIYPESILYPFVGKVHKATIMDHPTRKLTAETCKKWEIGYDKLSYRTVLPFRRSDGALLGVLSRATLKSDPIRYMIGLPNIDPMTKERSRTDPVKYTWSKKASGALYGEHFFQYHSKILVVESFLDVLWLDQLGVTEQMDVTAIGGAGLSRKQALALMSWQTVYLGLDMDEAGEVGTAKARELLQGSHIVRVNWLKKDPGEMTEKEVWKSLAYRSSVFDLPDL